MHQRSSGAMDGRDGEYPAVAGMMLTVSDIGNLGRQGLAEQMLMSDVGTHLAPVDPFDVVAQARQDRGPIVAQWMSCVLRPKLPVLMAAQSEAEE